MKLSKFEILTDLENFTVFEIEYTTLWSKKEKYALVIYIKDSGDFKNMSTGGKFWRRQEVLFEISLQYLKARKTTTIIHNEKIV